MTLIEYRLRKNVEKHLNFFEKYLTISDVITLHIPTTLHLSESCSVSDRILIPVLFVKPLYFSYKLKMGNNITYLVFLNLANNKIEMISLDDIIDISY